MSTKKNIAIFASGRGSNAVKIYAHGRDHSLFNVGLIISNRRNPPIFDFAKEHGIPHIRMSKEDLQSNKGVLDTLNSYNIDMIVLAGFMLLIPEYLINAYPNKMINIHPALLPKYGGKGMYGSHVHQAVFEAKEDYSGITIHMVNKHYDEGHIILQVKCDVSNMSSPEQVASTVLTLEHRFYPLVVASMVNKLG